MKLSVPHTPITTLAFGTRALVLLGLLHATHTALASDGVVANSRLAAVANRERITKALWARPPRTVTLPVGTIYVDGTITTRPVVGCGRFKTDASFGYGSIPTDHPSLGGSMTRIVQVGKGPLLRLSGAGFVSEDPIEWVGETKSAESTATKRDDTSVIVEVEGRVAPATGRHRFRNQIFTDADTAIRCLAGYYESQGDGRGGKFVADESHADNSIVDACEFFNIGRVFVSENQQALAWKFRDPVINYMGQRDCIFADIVRGGGITIDGLIINQPRTTIFKVHDYSPNTSQLACRNFWRDRPQSHDTNNNYLTLIEYAGPAHAKSYADWTLDISGFVPATLTSFDRSKLFVGCEGLPKKNWRNSVVVMGGKADTEKKSR